MGSSDVAFDVAFGREENGGGRRDICHVNAHAVRTPENRTHTTQLQTNAKEGRDVVVMVDAKLLKSPRRTEKTLEIASQPRR